MAKVTIEEVGNPDNRREVNDLSWKRWPKARDNNGNLMPGVKKAGKTFFREAEAEAPRPKERPKAIAPPEVQKLSKPDPNK